MTHHAEQTRELVLHTDGASRGNPGPAGAGVVITNDAGEVLVERAVYLGQVTNNVAEYKALLMGLDEAQAFSPCRLTVKMDSELIVRQLNGRYRVRSPDLIPLHRQAQESIRRLGRVEVMHVRRAYNRDADRLANQAIDEHAGGG